jgi:protein-arginine kinase
MEKFITLLIGMLPPKIRLSLEFSSQVFAHFDSAAERREVMDFINEVLDDGTVTAVEWNKLGVLLGIIKRDSPGAVHF